MKESPRDATREAAGCFGMLILGAISILGCMAVILPGLVGLMTGKPPTGLGRAALIWLVAPAIGIVVVAWLTSGFRRHDDPPRRR
jgi:hypothetical protein